MTAVSPKQPCPIYTSGELQALAGCADILPQLGESGRLGHSGATANDLSGSKVRNAQKT